MRRLALAIALLLAAVAGAAPSAARTARADGLVVAYTDPRDRAALLEVFAAWRAARRDLRDLGLAAPAARIEAAGSAADFARRTGEPWFVAASTRGAVIRTQRLSALASRGAARGLAVTVRHEAFHAAQPKGLPRFLAEGLARVFSGEAARDPAGPTGLEHRPDADLDALLAARDEATLGAAYVEATRRASRLVRVRGWRAVLAPFRGR